MNASLELILAIRRGVHYVGGGFKSERHFLDFSINGESLWAKIGQARDLVSILCFEYVVEEVLKDMRRLLLAEDAEILGDRHPIFICSECGDLGCGAITAHVVREGETIVWKDFGFENNYDEGILLEDYKHVGPYVFEWEQYERTLRHAIGTLKQGLPRST